jgi:hypothetical protein
MILLTCSGVASRFWTPVQEVTMSFTALIATLLPALAPSTVEFLSSASLVGMVLAGGAVALALLPWSDEELAAVDAEARALASTPLLARSSAAVVARS